MDRILIVDADGAHASMLVNALNRVNFRVEVCREYRSAVDHLAKYGADIVVIVPRSPSSWRNELKGFCDAIGYDEFRPEILCVLRWPPNGYGDRLFGDELNVEVINER